MKRKFYSKKEMARAKWDISLMYGYLKRNKLKGYPTNWNAGDCFYGHIVDKK